MLRTDPAVHYHREMANYRLDRKSEAASEPRRALLIDGAFPDAGRARKLLKERGR